MLYKILKIPAMPWEQKKQFKLLFVYALLLGSFWSLYEVVSHCAVIYSVGIEKLPVAYIISSLASILLSLLFRLLKKRMAISTYMQTINFSAFIAATAFLVFFYYFKSYVAYLVFAPSIYISYYVFLYYKNLIEIITHGQNRVVFYQSSMLMISVGIFITGLLTLGALYLDKHIYFIGLFLAPLSVALIVITIFVKKNTPAINKQTLSFENIKKSRSGKNIQYAMLFAALSGIIIHLQFIDYSYISYKSIWGLAKLLALFTATLYSFNYVFRKILIPRLLHVYDSPFGLPILPVFILAVPFAVIAFNIFTKNALHNTIALIYLLVFLLVKIIYETLRISNDWPSIKVLFISIYRSSYISRFIFDIHIYNSVGIIVGSLILLNLYMFIYASILINITLVISTGLWILFSIKAIKDFNARIKQKTTQIIPVTHSNSEENINYLINNCKLYDDDFFNFFKHLFPNKFPLLLEKLLEQQHEKTRKYGLQHINQIDLNKAMHFLEIENVIHNPNYELVTKSVEEISNDIKISNNEKELIKLTYSKKDSDRLKAAKLMYYCQSNKFDSHIIHLLHDTEPHVKGQAILTAVRFDNSEINYLLINYLNSANYFSYAFYTLSQKGDDVLDYIDQLLKNEIYPDEFIIRIIKLYENIASFKSVNKIIEFLDHPSKRIVFQAVRSLLDLNFKVNTIHSNKIYNLIVRQANYVAWMISIIVQLSKSEHYLALLESVIKEYRILLNELFQLLYLLYHNRAVKEAQGYFRLQTESGSNMACELLDSIIQEDLKKVILPIISGNSFTEKFRVLQHYYVLENSDSDIIKTIIRQDINIFSIPNKAYAIYSLLSFDSVKQFEDDLVTCLFDEHKIIRETAIFVIIKKFHYLLKKVFNRLNKETQEEIFNMNLPEYKYENLLLNIYNQYVNNTLFSSLNNDLLISLAEHSNYINVPPQTDYHLIKSDEPATGFMLVCEGNVRLFHNGERKGSYKEDDIVFAELSEQNENDLVILWSKFGAKVLVIDKLSFEKLNFDFRELFNQLFAHYTNKKKVNV